MVRYTPNHAFFCCSVPNHIIIQSAAYKVHKSARKKLLREGTKVLSKKYESMYVAAIKLGKFQEGMYVHFLNIAVDQHMKENKILLYC
jgi:hypothetical protein